MMRSQDLNLLHPDELDASSVVANCRMNRERRLGAYARELGIDPIAELWTRRPRSARAVWVDVCCGTGRALIECLQSIIDGGDAGWCEVVGLDLVGMFDPNPFPQLSPTVDRQDDRMTCEVGTVDPSSITN